MPQALRGVYAPVLTPLTKDLEPDSKRFIAHCQWLVGHHARLAIFGTNSEAASFSVSERIALTEQLLDAGIPPASLMPGTGACAISDAVELTRHAVAAGAPGVLMLPPFYFKNVSDEGVFAYFCEVIERVGNAALGVYLYHIPQVTLVPISLAVIERLLKRYPDTVRGIKDSSGDWNHASELITRFSSENFSVFPASESLLSKALPIGGAGCISATVNVNPSGIHALFEAWDSSNGKALQAHADRIRTIFQRLPMIPAMKQTVANFSGHKDWQLVRPPLTTLEPDVTAALQAELQAAHFEMSDYPATAD